MAVEASLLTKNDIIDLLRTKYGLEGNNCCLKDYYENFNNMDISIKYRERISKFSDVFGKIIQ